MNPPSNFLRTTDQAKELGTAAASGDLPLHPRDEPCQQWPHPHALPLPLRDLAPSPRIRAALAKRG